MWFRILLVPLLKPSSHAVTCQLQARIMIYTTAFQTSENLEQPREQDFLASTETLFLCCHILFYKKNWSKVQHCGNSANYSKWNKKAQYLYLCIYWTHSYISQPSNFQGLKTDFFFVYAVWLKSWKFNADGWKLTVFKSKCHISKSFFVVTVDEKAAKDASFLVVKPIEKKYSLINSPPSWKTW